MIRKHLSIALGLLVLSAPVFGQFIENVTIKNQLKMQAEPVSSALYLDATGKVKGSITTSKADLDNLSGTSGNLQTQINTNTTNIGTNTSAIATKADDSAVVHKTGNETVAGTKTVTGKTVASSTTNGFHPCPTMTDTQMLAIVSPANGDCVHNSTLSTWLVYSTTTSLWEEVGGGGGISNWVTAIPYAIGDVVIQSSKIYQALTVHTSGTFATDLAASKWVQIANNVSDSVGTLPLANGGTNKNLTPSNGGVLYTDADSAELLAPGTSGQVLQTNGAGSPSWVNKAISGKAQGSTSTTVEELQVPGKLLTQTASGKYLNETGNNNLLENPSFEHQTAGQGWLSSVTGTAVATYGSATTTTKELGDKQGTFSCVGGASGGTCIFYQDVTTSKLIPGLVYGVVSTDTPSGVKFRSRINGSVKNEIQAVQTGEYPYKIPEVLGSTSTGVGLLVTVSASQTITGTLDGMIVAAADIRQDISQCFSSSCEDSFEAKTSATGTVSDENIDFVNGNCSLSVSNFTCTFNSGLFTVTPNCYTTVADSAASINAVVSTVSTSSVTFQTYLTGNGAASARAFNFKCDKQGVDWMATQRAKVGNVYSATNADTGWADCGLTGSALTGFGAAVPTPSLQCKRSGGDLLLKGKFTAGTTPTAVEARLALPTWNGVQLTNKGTTAIPSIQYLGAAAVSTNSATTPNLLIEPSVSYVTFGLQSASSNGLTKVNGSQLALSGTVLSFEAVRIPINGWDDSNVITGTFNEVMTTPGIVKPRTCYLAFGGTGSLSSPTSCTGTCVKYYDNCGIFGTPTRSSAGVYTFTANSGSFANSSFIACSPVIGTAGGTFYGMISGSTFTTDASGGYTNGFRIATGATTSDGAGMLKCEGQAP